MLKDIKEKICVMNEIMINLSKKIKAIQKKQMKTIELKNEISGQIFHVD